MRGAIETMFIFPLEASIGKHIESQLMYSLHLSRCFRVPAGVGVQENPITRALVSLKGPADAGVGIGVLE